MGTVTQEFGPGTYTWTCPPGVTEVTIEMQGASSGDGEPGERVRHTVQVAPGVAYSRDAVLLGPDSPRPAVTGQPGRIVISYEDE